MSTQYDKAISLHALHTPATPLVLYNMWDAGGAIALQAEDAPAVATSSWSMATAHGCQDGQILPLPFVLQIVAHIAAAIQCPLSVDFEGGYAELPEQLAGNAALLLAAGAAGINFEDQLVAGSGLYPAAEQAERIRAIRATADQAGIPLFINARTDLFLQQPERHASVLDQALARLEVYAEAGADGFFVPGLSDPTLIAELCRLARLPINVMTSEACSKPRHFADLGVARISHGPAPYLQAMADLKLRWSAQAA